MRGGGESDSDTLALAESVELTDAVPDADIENDCEGSASVTDADCVPVTDRDRVVVPDGVADVLPRALWDAVTEAVSEGAPLEGDADTVMVLV